jgi:hypothetical protein
MASDEEVIAGAAEIRREVERVRKEHYGDFLPDPIAYAAKFSRLAIEAAERVRLDEAARLACDRLIREDRPE